MNLSEELTDALNAQVGMEFQASYSYLSMASYFEANSWDGFASWMSMQSDEEREHAMKFYAYLLDRGATVSLPAIEAPEKPASKPAPVPLADYWPRPWFPSREVWKPSRPGVWRFWVTSR